MDIASSYINYCIEQWWNVGTAGLRGVIDLNPRWFQCRHYTPKGFTHYTSVHYSMNHTLKQMWKYFDNRVIIFNYFYFGRYGRETHLVKALYGVRFWGWETELKSDLLTILVKASSVSHCFKISLNCSNEISDGLQTEIPGKEDEEDV